MRSVVWRIAIPLFALQAKKRMNRDKLRKEVLLHPKEWIHWPSPYVLLGSAHFLLLPYSSYSFHVIKTMNYCTFELHLFVSAH